VKAWKKLILTLWAWKKLILTLWAWKKLIYLVTARRSKPQKYSHIDCHSWNDPTLQIPKEIARELIQISKWKLWENCLASGNWTDEIYLPSTTDLAHIAQDQSLSFFCNNMTERLEYLMINVCPQRTYSIGRYHNSNFLFIQIPYFRNSLSQLI